jgi:flagellar hook assembly protein FlgD
MITNLKAVPARGQGMSLSYSLTGDASVGIDVLTLTGKVIRQIPAGTQSSGVRSVLWDGRDGQGRGVPGGAYLMRVTATGPDGQVVRAMQPANIR